MYPSTYIVNALYSTGHSPMPEKNAATLENKTKKRKKEEDGIPSKEMPIPMACEQLVLHDAIVPPPEVLWA